MSIKEIRIYVSDNNIRLFIPSHPSPYEGLSDPGGVCLLQGDPAIDLSLLCLNEVLSLIIDHAVIPDAFL